jgi:GTP-binding protein EngB required for normal cell division
MATIFNELGTAKADCDQISAEVRQFLQAQGRQPPSLGIEPIRLALCGQYNSGKSTIVNALLGERVAVTGDAPETKRAQVYCWKGFEVADLPGGDARLQESEEALGALKSAHAVLYVVSSATGLDYATMWEDLRLLVTRGIPFLVVVNDKKPHQDEASERDFRQQLGEHFRELAASKLPGQDWTNRFFWVRAKSAERGRLEHKERLVQGSGIVPLEHTLTLILRESDVTVRAAAHLRALQDELRSLTLALESANEAVELELKDISDALQRCDMARSRLDAVVNEVAAGFFGPLKDNISPKLCRAMSGEVGKDAVEAEVTNLLSETWQGALATVGRRCETELDELANRIGRDISHSSPKNRSAVKVHLGQIPVVKEESMDLRARLRQGVKDAIALGRLFPEANVPKAGKFIRWGVPIAIGALEIWDVYRAASRERRAQEMAAREAEAMAERVAREHRQHFLAEAHEWVAQTFGPFEKELRDELGARSRSAGDFAAKIATARSLSSRVGVVIQSLTGGKMA